MAELETVAEVRAGVEALRLERADANHTGRLEQERQRGELNALNAVMRLINTGDWITERERDRRVKLAAIHRGMGASGG